MKKKQAKTVSVIFTRTNTVLSFLLQMFLWSPWSHCAIIDGNEIIEAAAKHGVRRRLLAELIAESSKYEILDFVCDDPSKIHEAASNQIGKPYDWFGAIGLGIHRNWQDQNKWFCSELVAWAFHSAGYSLFRVEPWRITPRDLFIPFMSKESDYG